MGDGVFEVKATNGDTHLGGDDFDKRIVDWTAEEFKRDQGIDLRKDRQALQRLIEAAEKAKVELSAVPETTLSLPFITADAAGPKHLEMKLTRAKFDALTADLVERCRGPFERALADAKLTAQDLDEVILVGGATRTPAVLALVRKLTLGKEPHQGVNPDEVVAVGAAIQAAVLAGEMKDVVLLDVTPLSLGVETLGGLLTKLVERNTTIPVRRSQTFSTADDNQTAVDIHVLQGSGNWRGITARWASSAWRDPAGSPGRSADRGGLRHRRQRDRQRIRQGPWHREGAADHGDRDRPDGEGRDRAVAPRGRGACR